MGPEDAGFVTQPLATQEGGPCPCVGLRGA